MTYDPLDPDGDPFKPPEIPTGVSCLHCGEEYDSSLIEWRIESDAEGGMHGFWCCPTPGCDGRGFGFDLLPTDPEYRDERGGWFHDDEEGDEDDLDEEDLDEEDLAGGDLQEDFSEPEPDSEDRDSGNGHAKDDHVSW